MPNLRLEKETQKGVKGGSHLKVSK